MVVTGIGDIASIIGVADVATRVCLRLARFLEEARHAGETRSSLYMRAASLHDLLKAVQVATTSRKAKIRTKPISKDEGQILEVLNSAINRCDLTVEKLEGKLKALGENEKGPNRWQRLKLQAKLDVSDPLIVRIERDIQADVASLQMLFSCLSPFMHEETLTTLHLGHERTQQYLLTIEQTMESHGRLLESLSRRVLPPNNLPAMNEALATENMPEGENNIDDEPDLELMRESLSVARCLVDTISNRGSVVGGSISSGSTQLESKAGQLQEEPEDFEGSDKDFMTPGDGASCREPSVESDEGPMPAFATEAISEDLRIAQTEYFVNTFIHPENSGADQANDEIFPQELMTDFLEKYMSAAEDDLHSQKYQEALRKLNLAIETGERREATYNYPFDEKLKIQIIQAATHIQLQELDVAEPLLDALVSSTEEDSLQRGEIYYLMAKLRRARYCQLKEDAYLEPLEKAATLSYNFALRSNVVSKPYLRQSVEMLVEMYEWKGNSVGADLFRDRHPSVSLTSVTPAPYPSAAERSTKLLGPSTKGRQYSSGSQTLGSPPSLYATESQSSRDGLGRATSIGSVPTTAPTSYLQSITSSSLIARIQEGDVEIVKERLAAGADIEQVDEDTGLTPLLTAAKLKDKEICQVLLTNEPMAADINAKGRDGRSVLHIALSRSGGEDLIPLLLQHKADPSVADRDGKTPLHYCAELNKKTAVKDLLDANADIEALNNAKETALHLAIRKKKIALVEILLEAGATIDTGTMPETTRDIAYIVKKHLGELTSPRQKSKFSRQNSASTTLSGTTARTEGSRSFFRRRFSATPVASDVSSISTYSDEEAHSETEDLIALVSDNEVLDPLYRVLIEDEAIDPERFVRNFRRLLIVYAEALSRTANGTFEDHAARLVGSRAEYVANSIRARYVPYDRSIISNPVSPGFSVPDQARRKRIEQILAQLEWQVMNHQQSPTTENYNASELKNLTFVKFLVSGQPFEDLHRNALEFVRLQKLLRVSGDVTMPTIADKEVIEKGVLLPKETPFLLEAISSNLKKNPPILPKNHPLSMQTLPVSQQMFNGFLVSAKNLTILKDIPPVSKGSHPSTKEFTVKEESSPVSKSPPLSRSLSVPKSSPAPNQSPPESTESLPAASRSPPLSDLGPKCMPPIDLTVERSMNCLTNDTEFWDPLAQRVVLVMSVFLGRILNVLGYYFSSIRTHMTTVCRSKKEPLLALGQVRIRWTCQCGVSLWDDFKELRPGAALDLRNELQNFAREKKRSIRRKKAVPNSALRKPIEQSGSLSLSASTTEDNEDGALRDSAKKKAGSTIVVTRSQVPSASENEANRVLRAVTDTPRDLATHRRNQEDYAHAAGSSGSLDNPGNEIIGLAGTSTSFSAGPANRLQSLPNETDNRNISLGNTIVHHLSPGNLSTCDRKFLLLCLGKRNDTLRLHQLEIANISNDVGLFRLLQETYVTHRGRLARWFSPRRITSINFRKFERHPRERVVILPSPDILPGPTNPTACHKDHQLPKCNTAYDLHPTPPDLEPYIGRNGLAHLLNHPHEAEEAGNNLPIQNVWLKRFPKKEKTKLTVCPPYQFGLGWGIEFEEGWYLNWVMKAAICTSSAIAVVFMICWWSIRGDLQGAASTAALLEGFAALVVSVFGAVAVLNG